MSGGTSESTIVYLDATGCKCVTAVTRETLFESADAAEVIQAAMDACPDAGGTVLLEQGDYDLRAAVKLRSGVHLRGRGRSSRLRLAAENADGVGVLCEGINTAVVSDLAVVAGGGDAAGGVVLDDCGDCQVRDVTCAGLAGCGIEVRNGSFLSEVRGCRLAGNAEAGIRFHKLKKGRAGDYIANTISDCIIYGGGRGIDCEEAIVVNIVGCTVYQSKDTAYYLHRDTNSVLISGCRTFQITGSAVVVEDSHELNVTGNIFCWHTGHGIVVRGARWGAITGNEVIDTGSYNPGAADQAVALADVADKLTPCDAIRLLDVRGFSVTGNTLFNWPQGTRLAAGVREDNRSRMNLIANNNINYYGEADVVSEGRDSVVAGNVGHGDEPHRGSSSYPWCQSFRTELTDRFIAEQL
jgi:hypothetical protein